MLYHYGTDFWVIVWTFINWTCIPYSGINGHDKCNKSKIYVSVFKRNILMYKVRKTKNTWNSHVSLN